MDALRRVVMLTVVHLCRDCNQHADEFRTYVLLLFCKGLWWRLLSTSCDSGGGSLKINRHFRINTVAENRLDPVYDLSHRTAIVDKLNPTNAVSVGYTFEFLFCAWATELFCWRKFFLPPYVTALLQGYYVCLMYLPLPYNIAQVCWKYKEKCHWQSKINDLFLLWGGGGINTG
jgi:hypothetical protein